MQPEILELHNFEINIKMNKTGAVYWLMPTL